MAATLVNGPDGATKLYLPRYYVYREHKQIDVDYHLKNNAGDLLNTGTASITGANFDIFYPDWTTDDQLYEAVLEILDLDGTVDLAGEPE